MTTLSDRVRIAIAAAKENGHPVSDIAKKCGISVAAVYAWASGDSKSIDGNHLVELAELSGLNAKWIIKGEGRKTPFSSDPQVAAAQKTILRIAERDISQLDTVNKMLAPLAEPNGEDRPLPRVSR